MCQLNTAVLRVGKQRGKYNVLLILLDGVFPLLIFCSSICLLGYLLLYLSVGMELQSYRVQNFRSVKDSGWIELDHVTGFIGANESGKTNLLLPLWYLNAAAGEEPTPLDDMPRSMYADLKNSENSVIFITAKFKLSEGDSKKIEEETFGVVAGLRDIYVSRCCEGHLWVEFPDDFNVSRRLNPQLVRGYLGRIEAEAKKMLAPKKDNPEAIKLFDAFKKSDGLLRRDDCQIETEDDISNVLLGVTTTLNVGAVKSLFNDKDFNNLNRWLNNLVSFSAFDEVEENSSLRNNVKELLPIFVYYSNYGNLDSEIYLPHVIDNSERDDLRGKELAKHKTLDILFKFVGLSPQEINDLGKNESTGDLTAEEAQSEAIKRKERFVLLGSASTSLTTKFREWWKQGDYKFEFTADGDHFRIWVSDSLRPEPIELESRSSGLQWFFSFFLTFLVETRGKNKGAILLLDEPGHTLHPLSQKDLSRFFESLSQTNKLLYTTHSPFLVDDSHLERYRAVYVDSSGLTVVSDNLRQPSMQNQKFKSVYAVHAAIGISASETLFLGCDIVFVEGKSDQLILEAIKFKLVSEGKIKLGKEIVFLPAGGVKGISTLVKVFARDGDDYPRIVLDGDSAGIGIKDSLVGGVYADCQERIVLLSDVLEKECAEIEDMLPSDFLCDYFNRSVIRQYDADVSQEVNSQKAVVPQLEAFLTENGISCPAHWKVSVAGSFKKALPAMSIDDGLMTSWRKVFDNISSVKRPTSRKRSAK